MVTGASGFVGVNLVRYLVDQGWAVRAVDLEPPSVGCPVSVDHTIADVRDRPRMHEVFDGADVVFHLAARITLATHDAAAWDDNVRGPAVVALAALEQGVGRLVHCSSVHAFDLSQAHPRLDEHTPRSTSGDRPIYDRSKATGEAEVRKAVEHGLDAVVVNPTGIIGPIDHGPSRANGLLASASRGRMPVVVGGGFDWVDVRDVVLGLVAAADRGRTGESYLLGGHQASALFLARMAGGMNGHLGPLVAVPSRVAEVFAPLGERVGRWFDTDNFTPASIGTLADHPIVDHAKASRELGYAPRPLEQTVGDLVRWFESDPGT